MFGVEFVFQVFQFIDDLLGMLGAELVDITCTVIAKRAFAPVTTARAKIGHEFFRRKIFFPHECVGFVEGSYYVSSAFGVHFLNGTFEKRKN